ncbi:hypothetical protein VTI74DRAFT_9054 [Chaetomium olivicolor]
MHFPKFPPEDGNVGITAPSSRGTGHNTSFPSSSSRCRMSRPFLPRPMVFTCASDSNNHHHSSIKRTPSRSKIFRKKAQASSAAALHRWHPHPPLTNKAFLGEVFFLLSTGKRGRTVVRQINLHQPHRVQSPRPLHILPNQELEFLTAVVPHPPGRQIAEVQPLHCAEAWGGF